MHLLYNTTPPFLIYYNIFNNNYKYLIILFTILYFILTLIFTINLDYDLMLLHLKIYLYKNFSFFLHILHHKLLENH